MSIIRLVYRCFVVTLFRVVRKAIETVKIMRVMPWPTFIRLSSLTKEKREATGQSESDDFSNDVVDSVERLTIPTIVYKNAKVTSVSPRHFSAATSYFT